ncbi:STAS domain-containing protein [Motilibacter aurantiacus]|uniref:STAS domain-containing protein n=1 Tax=Motilibacter aurantiacus TaxID=2714955 RepID=UPI0014085F30|nr:STAS domain-containing protein [Motilibacter aurantiacus]NHC46966.1 STAS domain-containing protein [Motilibacter aurantiacus]
MRATAVYTVALSGEVDLALNDRLDAMAAAFERGPAADARVDLRDVTFMDSAGLAFVARLIRAAADRGGEVVLLGPPPALRRVLAVSGLDRLARIVPA